MIIKVSVKDIVELIYGSGNLVSSTYLKKRAEEGIKIHVERQSHYQDGDEKEVYIDYHAEINGKSLFISGRIDGVIKNEDKIIIEEIKSTTKDLAFIDETTTPAHLAQARFYAYFYALKNNLSEISVRLIYIQTQSRQIKELKFVFTLVELKDFFDSTIEKYIVWLVIIEQHEQVRNKSLTDFKFPFPDYRKGQRSLMEGCYQNILKRGILYALAPTGIGKTVATLFSSLKAINQERQKIFYLTAKNLGKQVVLKTVDLLQKNGLIAKAIEITAKDQSCFQEVRDCDPAKCPYAKGYYNRVFKAVQDLFENEDIFSKELIKAYALKHQICPFEYSLDASFYADIIICDYNYVFCPLTHLLRYFEEDSYYQPILLVDEAHNLVSRSKDMYSGSISKIKILSLAKYLKDTKCNIKKETKELLVFFEGYAERLEKNPYQVLDFQKEFVEKVYKVFLKVEEFLENENEMASKKEIIQILFDLLRFIKNADYFDNDFIYAIEKSQADLIVNINCLDASKFIIETLTKKTYSSVFFSATLYPIHYYKRMLTQDLGDFISITSPFSQENLNIIAIPDVSTRYQDRPNSIEKIVDVLRILGNSKPGNYIVFFPSYQYLSMVYEDIKGKNFDFEFIVQKRDFTHQEREDVINLFKNNNQTQIGLFVMGGIFSEGIDYLGDMLSGVIIVGTGLPLYGGYNNIVRSHFDEEFGNGFDFAYTYPGFSKVVQAVGRVIRTEQDRGTAILIDDRFVSSKYLRLYPEEWSHLKRVSDLPDLINVLEDFWNK